MAQVYLQTGPLGRHQTVNPVWVRWCWCWCPLQAGWQVLTERRQMTSLFKKDLMSLYKHVLVLKYRNRLPVLMLQIFKMTILTCGLIHNFNESLISSYSLTSAPPPLRFILTDTALRPHPRPADWAHSTEEGKTALGLCHPSGTTSCSQPGNRQL